MFVRESQAKGPLSMSIDPSSLVSSQCLRMITVDCSRTENTLEDDECMIERKSEPKAVISDIMEINYFVLHIEASNNV